MKVFEVVEHRQRLDEGWFVPIIMGVGALISGYLAYEDAMEAIDNYVHGEDKFGNPYGATDLTLDLGGELAEIVIGATIAGAGWKAQKITRQAISRWWRKSDDIAKRLAKPSSFASVNVLNNLTLTQWVTIGTLTHIIGETPESVYDIYKAYQSGNITWEDVENRAIEELYGVLLGLGFAAGFALVGKVGSITKPYFVDMWNYSKRVFRNKDDLTLTETATSMGASSIATVSGNVGTVRSRNMYNADGTMVNALDYGNLLGGVAKPKKKKKTRKNT